LIKAEVLKRSQYSHMHPLEELRFHPREWHSYLGMKEETKDIFEFTLYGYSTNCKTRYLHEGISISSRKAHTNVKIVGHR
jgi:hypothetical protein